MPPRILGPRAEHRQQENQRARDSVSIAQKFPLLKSLTVDLAFSTADGQGNPNRIKYRANLANAKSVFLFDCPNNECVGGDFDLSSDLTSAYANHRATMSGEAHCQGWRSKTVIGTCRCPHVLRFTLNLEFESEPASALVSSAPSQIISMPDHEAKAACSGE